MRSTPSASDARKQKFRAARNAVTDNSAIDLANRARPKLEDFGLPGDFGAESLLIREKKRERFSNIIRHIFSSICLIAAYFFVVRDRGESLNFENTLAILWASLFFYGLCYAISITFPFDQMLRILQGDSKNLRCLRNFESALRLWEHNCLMTGAGFWQSLRGRGLESAISQLFREQGWQVVPTAITGDGGVDLILSRNHVEIWCQCKGHAKPVSVAAVREIAGVSTASHASPMLIVVNGLTKPARLESQNLGVLVWDSQEIASFARGELSIPN